MDPQLQQLLQQLLSATNANTAHVTNAINTLNNRLGTLEQTVARNNNITESLSNETRRYNNNAHTQTRIDDALNHFEDTFKKALQAAGGKFVKKDGTLTKSAEDRVTRLVHGDKFRKHAEPILSAKVNAYDVAHPGNTRDFTDFREGAQLLRDALASFDNKSADSLKLSNAQRTRFYREANIGGRLTNKDRMEDHFVTRTDRSGNYEHLSVETSLSRARDELNDLSKEIIKTTQLLQLQNEETTKVNTALTNLANNSTMIDNMLQGLKTTADTASGATLGFADMIDSVTNKPGRGLQLLNDNIGSTRDALKKLRASTNSVTRANERAIKRLQDAGSGGIGSSNTFQEQARKNSDRARTAGFLALLIPELAKLLKKNNPVADLLKYGALRLGSGKSGMGDHPVMGAIAYGLSGVALTAITALLWRNPKTVAMLSRLSAPMLNSISKMTGGLTRNFGLFASAVRVGAKQGAQSGKFLGGVRGGLNTAVRLSRAYKLGTTANYATRKGLMGPFVNSGNVNLWRSRAYATGGKLYPSNLAANPGRVAELQMEKMGMNTARFWRTPTRGLLGAGRLRMPLGLARGAKALGKFGGPLAFLGYAAEDLGKFGDAYKEGGVGGALKQTGKTIAGATAGTIGTFAGAALGAVGGPLGVAIGGAIGGVLGKALSDVITNNGDKHAKEIATRMKEQAGVSEGFYAECLDRLAIMVSWWDNFKEWLKQHIPGANRSPGPDGNPVGNSVRDQVVIEKGNQAKLKQQKDEIEQQLKAYKDPNSVKYRGKWGNLYEQYIRANTKAGGNKTIAQRLGFGEQDPELEKAAKAWATKKMNEQKTALEAKLKSTTTGLAASNNAVGTLKAYNSNPFKGDIVTSGFGWRNTPGGREYHKGVDLVVPNKIVRAKMGGVVTAIGDKKDGFGDVVRVRDAFGATHLYAHGVHNSQVVKVGQRVNAGDRLMTMGNTGASRGAHLHYGVYSARGKVLNPIQYTMSAAGKDKFDPSLIKAPAETPTLTGGVSMSDVKETASSEIRQTLAQLAGIAQNNSKQARTKSVIFSATDVTGSLGVWGITQMNNGVVNIGK